jgi:hypothetical protein
MGDCSFESKRKYKGFYPLTVFAKPIHHYQTNCIFLGVGVGRLVFYFNLCNLLFVDQLNQRLCIPPNVFRFLLPVRLQWVEPPGGEAESGNPQMFCGKRIH